ncbi:hypothetical protein KKJ17_17075 [Xenorhabdus bovienii]|uniref:hypothetical protein n=1 Tax=Xenorhabdus bovienii TaxID=40576 RepID=UPI0023B3324C|nr:hypothetical protein [Xenorhabdus bovienii]MDE9519394.1 hypothetical protein [Xenorhabdus bovienii]
MKKYLLCLFFFLYGCSGPSSHILPKSNHLPDAFVNKPYKTSILMNNMSIMKESLHVEITPNNSGLQWNPYRTIVQRGEKKEIRESYNNIIINGIPIIPGEIKITLYGATRGTMFTKVNEFDKSYTIKVRE